MAELQITNVGKMWHVKDGNRVLGFATDYPMALDKRRTFIKEGTAERVALIHNNRGVTPCQR